MVLVDRLECRRTTIRLQVGRQKLKSGTQSTSEKVQVGDEPDPTNLNLQVTAEAWVSACRLCPQTNENDENNNINNICRVRVWVIRFWQGSWRCRAAV